jgi:hypothetical protein
MEQPTEVIEATPTPLSIDSGIVDAPPSLDASLVNPPVALTDDDTLHTGIETAAMVNAASEGVETPDTLLRHGSVENGVVEQGKQIIAGEQDGIKEDFNNAAKSGEATLLEFYAGQWVNAQASRESLVTRNATRLVATRAAENTMLASKTVIEQNIPASLTKIADEKGLEYASELLLDSRIKQRYGHEVTAVEGVGTLVSVLGTLVGLSKINPIAGTIAGAGTTVYSLWEQKVLRDALKNMVNIDIGEVFGVSDTLNVYNRHLATLPKDQALALQQKVFDHILDKGDVLPGFVGKTFATGLAARVHTGVENAPGWNLSNRTLDTIDLVAGSIDGVALLKLAKRAASPAKSLEQLSGGSVVGKQVADDAIKGTNTLGVSNEQQVDWMLSSNIEQLFPDGLKNSAGAAQDKLKKDAALLMEQLDQQIKLTNDDTTKQLREFVASNYSESGSSIARYDAATGEMVLQHPTKAAPFASEVVAKQFADKMQQMFPGEYKVIPSNSPSRAMFSIDEMDIPEHAFTTTKVKPLKVENESLEMVVREGGSALDALDAVAQSSKNEGLKGLAERILNNKSLNLGSVNITDISAFEKESAGGKITGLYRYLVDSIGVDKARAVQSESTVVHEIAHAVTGQIIDAVHLAGKRVGKTVISDAHITGQQRVAVGALDNIYKALVNSDLKLGFMGEKYTISRMTKMDKSGFSGLDVAMLSDHKDFGKYYGFTNVHEMIAEATTNKEFARVLKNIPLSKIIKNETLLEMLGGGARTVWDALVSTWRKLLGVKEGAEASVLDAIIENTTKLVDTASERQRTYFKELADKGLITEKDFELIRSKRSTSTGYYVVRSGTTAVHDIADIESRFGAGLDPKHRASEKAMHESYIALTQLQRDKKLMATFIQDTIGKLDNKQFKEVDRVLREGDTLGQEFNDVQLAARGLRSDVEKSGYYAYRVLENIALQVKNQRMVQQLERDGWTQGFIRLAGQTHAVPANIVSAADFIGKRAWNTGTNGWVTIDPMTQIIKTRRSLTVGGKNTTLFVRTPDITLGNWVPQLPSLTGSYRRIYKQDYFGRVKMTREIDGEMVEDWLHLRTSNSGKDVSKWSAGMNNILKNVKNNPGGNTLRYIEEQVGKWENPQEVYDSILRGEWEHYSDNGFSFKYNRNEEETTQSLIKGTSDAYELETKSRGIKLESIDKWNDVNVMTPMEALGAELSNVARVRNVGPWRDKWVDVWWNTFKDTLDPAIVRGRRPIEVISDPALNFSMYTGGDKAAKFAESQRKYILNQIGIPTLEEKTYQAAMERLFFGASGDTTLGKGIVAAGHFMRNADPLQFARSFNFFTMLGAWNPAQLIVQSQAMLNIVAISPVQGFKAAMAMPVLRTALMSDNPAVWAKVAKAYAGDTNEFIEVVKAIRRTGIIDGIGATSMHNIENGALNMYNGLVGKGVRTNTMFFNRGEEASRITAFDTARREWMSANPGQAWNTDAVLRNIMSRTDDLTQNMTQSNLAFYQRGLMSIPGQYLQYQLKLGANIISSIGQGGSGRGFTRSEASRLMATHLLGYGLAGNGLVWMYDEISNGYEKVSGSKMSDDQKLAVVEGGLSWLANGMSEYVSGEPLRVGLGSRLGTFNWYHDIVSKAVQADASFWSTVLGPSSSIPKKFGALQHLVSPFVVGDLSQEAFATATNDVLKEFLSSWSNSSKAIYAWNNDGKLVSKQGVVVGHASAMEIVAQAVGMPPAEQYDYWRYMMNKRDLDKSVREFAKTYVEVDEKRLAIIEKNNYQSNDLVLKYDQALAAIMKGVPPGLYSDFHKERMKIISRKVDSTGVPALVSKHIELIDRGLKLKDTPFTKGYGVEE